MRTWNEVTLYRVDRETTYQHIDALFIQMVDWEVIERHWRFGQYVLDMDTPSEP